MPDDFYIGSELSVDTGVDVPKDQFRDAINASKNRGFNSLAKNLSGKAGFPIVVAQDESGLVNDGSPMNLGGGDIQGYRAGRPSTGEWTAATLTINAANALTYAGAVLIANRGSGQTLTIDAAASDKFCVTILQKGSGQVTVAVSGGLTLRNRQSHTKSAGQWALISLFVVGSDLILGGDTAP